MSFTIAPYIADLVRIGILFAIVGGLAAPLTWAERRQAAMIQDRLGPNRAGITLFGHEYRAFGLFHPIADAIKLFTKEEIINERVDLFLYSLAPMIALFPALVTFAVIPFGPDITINGQSYQLQVARIDDGILYIFAMSSLAVFGVTLAGYASASKFAMLGGLRASAQMISYEVTMGMSVIGLITIFGTLEPSEMVLQQGHLLWGWLPKWGIIVQPIGFIVFMTASIAENKRTPFDSAEGESEIIGYFAEYSGMKFGMFYAAEYIEVIIVAGVVTTLFLGGWQIPYLASDGFRFPFGGFIHVPQGLVVALQLGAFMFKLFFMMWFQMMVRWTLLRWRYDQVMELCWRNLLPISLLNILVTTAIVLW